MTGLGPFQAVGMIKPPKRIVRKALAPAPLKGGGALQNPSVKGAGPAPQDSLPAPASAAPASNAAPWQPLVDAQVMGIYAGRDQSLAGLDQAEKYLKLDFGLIQNPDGSFGVDVNNPQGKAAMLQSTYLNARRGDLNGMAAQGQLYSGGLATVMDTRNRNEQMDFSTLTRNYSQGLGDIENQRGQLIGQAAADDAAARLQGAMAFAGDSNNTDAPGGGAGAGAAPASAGPKAGFQFVQSDGPRAGLSYKLEKRADGKWVRVYENGDRILRP